MRALKLFFCLLASLILSSCFKTGEIQPDFIDNTQFVLNKLLEIHNLPASEHFSKCLSESKDSGQLMSLLEEFSRNGAYSSSGTVSKVLSSSFEKLKKIMNKNVIGCLEGSNDFQVLLHHLNITQNNMFSQFEAKCKSNSLEIHYLFTNLTSTFNNQKINDTEKYTMIAKQINELATFVYLKPGFKFADDHWKLRAEQVETLSEYFGISVSNGVLGVVSSKRPFKLTSSVLAGAYDKVGRGRVDNLIQTFPALNIEMSFGGSSDYSNYVQEVDMKHGSMTHSLSSSKMSLSYTYMALQNLPNVLYTQVSVTAHEDGELVVKNLHEFPDALIDYEKYQEDIDTAVGVFNILSSQAKTKTGKLILVAASSFHFLSEEKISILHEDWDSNLHYQKFKRNIKKGEKFNFVVVTCLMSNENHDDPINEAIRMVIRAKSMNSNSIQLAHNRKWEEYWESDIIIEGNDVDQKYVRSMLYHFYSFINGFKSYGLSPMGLSGLGYNGHVFWDMDLWMYPAILILNPALAKVLINYRYERLEAAKQNAFLNGYQGAMFPWESSKSGSEETPVWALTGPLEHHISGCVAFSAWNYFLVTQDKEWLIEKGYPIIYQVALFFESRVEIGNDGFYHINNVVGADEWAENIDDDAFTNGVAKVALQIANKAAKVLGLATNSKWDDISNKIVILKMASGVTKEHSTYNGENIKQADVNLLSFPLKLITKNDEISKDLEYYLVRVPDSGTPAMTYSIFSLLYSRLKNSTSAYTHFQGSFMPFIRKPFGVFAETKGGSNPYFMTGAGGVLQSLIFGFAGYDITDSGVSIKDPILPSQWKKLSVKSKAKVIKI